MGDLLDGREHFAKRQRMAQIMGRLSGCALRYLTLSPKYEELADMTGQLIMHRAFPDISLDGEQFIRLEELLIMLDAWDRKKRDDAFRFALYHMRKCLKIDPYALPPVVGFLDRHPANLGRLRSIIGILSLMWVFKQDGHPVLSHNDFLQAHPELASRKGTPRL
jgi:hypothetical protein